MSTPNSCSTKSFLLLYASQTGQAKAIAEEIHYTAPSYGLNANLFCLSLTDKKFSIEKESCVVFVVSTTGDGEPPDSASKLLRRLNRQTLKSNFLENLNFSLLALGDSNYIKFCLFGRQLEKRLKALSAKPFYPTGYGDDAFGIETGVDPWIRDLWPALQKLLCVNSAITNGLETNNICSDFHLHNTNSHIIRNNINKTTMEKYFVDKTNISICDLLTSDFDIKNCRVPKLPPLLLSVIYKKCDTEKEIHFTPSEVNLHSKASPLTKVKVIAAKKLTHGDSVKTTLELTFRFEDERISYVPGDSFGFICFNSLNEVESLLERLNIRQFADTLLQLQLQASNIKKKIPSHIPTSLTVRDVILHCIEIRSIPKKILLRVLAEYTPDDREKETLLFLSSPEGSRFYTECVRKPSLNILDILLHFQSCAPPLEILLEYLPSLKPRFYSVSCSPLEDPSMFRIVFNVLKIKKGGGRMNDRQGVCTGWMNELSSELQKVAEEEGLNEQMSKLNLVSQKTSIFVYKRQNNFFHFPEKLDSPIIMVGPGTGIAPFIGYLQHREKLQSATEHNLKSEVWFFYGCRYENQDFLFRAELERLEKIGILSHLMVSLSREPSLPDSVKTRYVHENLRLNAKGVAAAVNAGGKILVCGDALHMAQDVQNAFIDVFQNSCDLTEEEAKSFVKQLQEDHRYINDVWA